MLLINNTDVSIYFEQENGRLGGGLVEVCTGGVENIDVSYAYRIFSDIGSCSLLQDATFKWQVTNFGKLNATIQEGKMISVSRR